MSQQIKSEVMHIQAALQCLAIKRYLQLSAEWKSDLHKDNSAWHNTLCF